MIVQQVHYQITTQIVPTQDPSLLSYTLAQSQSAADRQKLHKRKRRAGIRVGSTGLASGRAGRNTAKDGCVHSQPWPNKWNCCLGSEELALRRDTAGGVGRPDRDRRGHWSRVAGLHSSHHSHQLQQTALSCSQREKFVEGGKRTHLAEATT